MPNPAFKVRPKPIQAKRAFGTYAKDMNFVSLPANKHPSEAMELVWSNNAKEETGEISFINAATVLSVVKEYGKYTGTILEKTAEKHPMHKAANNKRFVISNARVSSPNCAGKNVCAACDTPSPITAKKKYTVNITPFAAENAGPKAVPERIVLPTNTAFTNVTKNTGVAIFPIRPIAFKLGNRKGNLNGGGPFNRYPKSCFRASHFFPLTIIDRTNNVVTTICANAVAQATPAIPALKQNTAMKSPKPLTAAATNVAFKGVYGSSVAKCADCITAHAIAAGNANSLIFVYVAACGINTNEFAPTYFVNPGM